MSPGYYFGSGLSATSRVNPRPAGGTGPCHDPNCRMVGWAGTQRAPYPLLPLSSPQPPCFADRTNTAGAAAPNRAVKLLLNTWGLHLFRCICIYK